MCLVFDRFSCQCPADLRVMLNTARMGFYHTLCFSPPLRVSLCPPQWQQFLFYSLNHFQRRKKLFTLKSVKFWAWFSLYGIGRAACGSRYFFVGFCSMSGGRCQGLVSNDCGINSYVTESSQAGPNLWGSRTMQCLFPLPAGDSCGHSSQCGQENPPRPPDWRYCGL